MDGWILPALVAVVLWGIVGVLQKLGTNRVDATSLLIWVMVGYILVLPLMFWRSGSWVFSPTVLLVGVLAGCVNGLGTWLLFRSLESGAKASIAVPLTALYPAITVLLASVFLAERLSAREWLGIALALCGGAMLTYERERRPGDAERGDAVATPSRRRLVLATECGRDRARGSQSDRPFRLGVRLDLVPWYSV